MQMQTDKTQKMQARAGTMFPTKFESRDVSQ